MRGIPTNRYGIVYLIRNTVNNKVYIGRTVQTIEQRWYQHVNDTIKGPHTRCLLNAIRKYGVDSFTIRALTPIISYEETAELEIAFITKYKSFPPELELGYNMTPGGLGGGPVNNACTPQTRIKIGNANRGKIRTLEQRRALSVALQGKVITWGEKISATLKEKNIRPPGGKKGMKMPPRSVEHLRKLKEAKQHWWDEKKANASAA